jgi:hypothetical protein
LGISGFVKVIKEKDFKDAIKDGKEKDLKEFKEGKEIIKEKDKKEFKEFKELKEKDRKEFKEFKEGKEFEKSIDVGGGGGFGAGQAYLEERMQNLESSLQQLSHFITAANRPDLQASLFGEGSGEDEFQKNSADAKSAKDDKDIDTM